MKKIRVCAIYDNTLASPPRNDGTPIYTKWNFLQREDVEYVHLLPLKGDRTIEQFGTFDVYFWPDHGEDCFPEYMKDPLVCPHPSVYWVSDLHWSEASKTYRIEKAKEFDLVLCHHKQHVDVMKDALGHDRVHWVPFAVEPKAYPYAQAIKKYDWGFVGHLNTDHRIAALDAMLTAIPDGWIVWKRFFEKAAAIFQESKVSFNISVAKDLNMRVFEVMGSGGFLLTDRAEGLTDLFEDGKHLVIYDSIPDAIEKAKYYIEHDDEREAIAKAGYDEVMAHHTYKHRVDTIMTLAAQYGLIHAPEEVLV